MKNVFLYFFLLVMLAISGCSTEKEAAGGKLRVVSTTGMIHDIVLNVAGDSVQSRALMGPGVDPHLYKATQGDVQKLTEADVIFYNGLHLEGKMGEVFEKLQRTRKVVPVAEAVPDSLRLKNEAFQNAVDPHVWFDVKRWQYAVKLVSRELQAQDPGNAAYYRENTERYLADLDTLDQEIRNELQQIPEERRILITSHDAFGYFGDAYDIDVRALQGLSTLSEYGLQDLNRLSDLIIEKKIRSVFVETSISERAIESLVKGVKERGFPVAIGGKLYSDAMGDPGTQEGTYAGMLKKNTQTITRALK